MCISMSEMQSFTRRELQEAWEKAAKNIEGYHIHIYFEKGTTSEREAQRLAADLQVLFPDDIEGRYNVGIVGPHVAPNIELDITREGFTRIVQWLQVNSCGLSILVHPETGDDAKDHLQSSMWLNKEVGYNNDFFARLAAKQAMMPMV